MSVSYSKLDQSRWNYSRRNLTKRRRGTNIHRGRNIEYWMVPEIEDISPEHEFVALLELK